jgi:LuxR family maltose regulon positive regulatory protein
MSVPILATKLYIPPVRPELVSRSRLIDQLNNGLNRKLTLISAPAGFGKTTLVSDWLRQLDIPIAWVSLDESDNDPVRFLTYFIAALQIIEAPQEHTGDIGQGALSALQSSQPPPTETILTSLINDVAGIPDKLLLILDDYHLIEAQSIHDALTFLLERLPPQMHLVIASRDDPHLPLARLRARGQLTELRAIDLRFTSAEAAEFLNQVMGLNLSAEDITALEIRTEGWIAGLQLAALALQGTISTQGQQDVTHFIKSFTGSHHFILDYLLEEVLEQQPEEIQAFLLRTSILDRLCGRLCDAVASVEATSRSTGTALLSSAKPLGPSASGQETLEYLQHANLFIIPLDEERRWYRYHHLFSDLLRQRLRQIQPEQVSTLHLQASEWYEQNGFVDEAIEYALRAEDFERAACLIEELAEIVWGRGEHTKLWSWLKALPAEQLSSRPRLCIFRAWVLFARGQQDAAELSLQAVEQALASDPTTDTVEALPGDPDRLADLDKATLQGRVATIRAFIASFRGDGSEIIKYAHRALEYLPEQDSVWRSSAAIVLGDAYGFSGDVAAAHQARLEALKASEATGNIYLILIASLKLAVALRQQGRLQRVIEVCQQQSELVTEGGLSQSAIVGSLFAVWGEALCEKNNLDEAIEYTEKGVEHSKLGSDVGALGWSYLCLVRVLFSGQDLAGAEDAIHKMEKIGRESSVPPWVTNQMAAWQVRIWLAQEKLEAASQWMKECGLSLDGELPFLREPEYLALARIFIAQGRLTETTQLLQRLIETAESGERTSRVIEMLALQALAFQAGGDPAQAMIPLEKALTLAEPGGFIRIFVDEGSPMARLLYEARERNILPDYTGRLLAAFSVAQTDQPAPPKTHAPKSELVEPLSERELEVLQLVAEGLTNQEIATRLFLTLNTVKVHTRNIYGKLGVNNRTQAVARARDLGMLPST